MMQTDCRDMFEKIFNNVNTWLHFAEAKYAALVALDIVAIQILVENANANSGCSFVFFAICLIGIIISLSVSLVSFYPRNKLQQSQHGGQEGTCFILEISHHSNRRNMLKVFWMNTEKLKTPFNLLDLQLTTQKKLWQTRELLVERINYFAGH